MKVDDTSVEDVARELYIRALKILPPDIKAGFDALVASETAPVAQRVLATMVTNIKVAEDTDNLLCQDTGLPIYNVAIGRGVEVDGRALQAGDPPRLRARDARASAALVGRASADAPQRAHVVRHRGAGDPRRLRRAARDAARSR